DEGLKHFPDGRVRAVGGIDRVWRQVDRRRKTLDERRRIRIRAQLRRAQAGDDRRELGIRERRHPLVAIESDVALAAAHVLGGAPQLEDRGVGLKGHCAVATANTVSQIHRSLNAWLYCSPTAGPSTSAKRPCPPGRPSIIHTM